MPKVNKNIRYNIIREADKRFRKYGIKAVTMDDIAKSLGISKRTLYETYPNKENVLIEVVLNILEEFEDRMHEFELDTDNVMDILCETLLIQLEFSAATNSAFFSDLEKYPKVEKLLLEHNSEQREKALCFYKKGVMQGYFRSDINYVVFSRLIHGFSRMIRTSKDYNDLTFSQLFVNCHSVIIRGICTKKGMDRFEIFMNDNFNNSQK